jgi:hypothetical protein
MADHDNHNGLTREELAAREVAQLEQLYRLYEQRAQQSTSKRDKQAYGSRMRKLASLAYRISGKRIDETTNEQTWVKSAGLWVRMPGA